MSVTAFGIKAKMGHLVSMFSHYHERSLDQVVGPSSKRPMSLERHFGLTVDELHSVEVEIESAVDRSCQLTVAKFLNGFAIVMPLLDGEVWYVDSRDLDRFQKTMVIICITSKWIKYLDDHGGGKPSLIIGLSWLWSSTHSEASLEDEELEEEETLRSFLRGLESLVVLCYIRV
ncbi:hypothetical protein FNV43_RR12171 [Rhamnella rubrinervis]|uniref:Uncharacterized protein n=1 Tax=Rhamnella rubrinervis TaxID=2594499 RepID=A0A8K0MIA4_9ROSA|nr:hypothetical protein FNV43_RR12171 [Rhamnella rubrinervis]